MRFWAKCPSASILLYICIKVLSGFDNIFQTLEGVGIKYLPDLLDSKKLNLVDGETRDLLHRCKRNLTRQWAEELSRQTADSHGHPLHILGDWSYDIISSNAIYKCLVSMRAPQDLYVRIMHMWQRELQFYADSFTGDALCKNVKKIRVKKYQSFYILFINRVTWIYGFNSFGQCPFCHTDAKVYFTHVFYACPKVTDVWTLF